MRTYSTKELIIYKCIYLYEALFIWIAFFVIQIQRIPNNLFGALFGMFITIILTGLWFTTLDKLKEWVDKKGLK